MVDLLRLPLESAQRRTKATPIVLRILILKFVSVTNIRVFFMFSAIGVRVSCGGIVESDQHTTIVLLEIFKRFHE